MQKKQQNKKSCDLANNTDWETIQVVRIWTHIIQRIANGKCTWELQSLVVLHFKALWNMPYLTTFPTFYFQGSSVDNETIALFLKLIKRLHLARVVKHRFMNTSNSDYLQMLIKTHRTEKLPSFYVGICFPRGKRNNARCLSTLSHSFPKDNGELFLWELGEEHNSWL